MKLTMDLDTGVNTREEIRGQWLREQIDVRKEGEELGWVGAFMRDDDGVV